jgi:GntR family transcriptional regulator / MocR family aminotransferase
MRIKRTPIMMTWQQGLGNPRRVADALREVIAERRVVAGEVLPSSRDLAQQLGVARNTVLQAIALLAADGLVESRPGVGVFVKLRPMAHRKPMLESAPAVILSEWAQQLPDVTQVVEDTGAVLDFRPGLPDLRSIPFDDWRRSAVRKLKTLRSQVSAYGEPQGDGALRVEIARYVARSRGVCCEADDVIITSGAQQAFDLIARLLIRPNAKVVLEEPGYRPAALSFAAQGAQICAVPVDEDGLDVAQLPNDAVMAYVTPSHQYPLGVTLSPARGADLLAWAERRNAFIVEDDYDSEYRYTGSALQALYAADRSQRVLYVGTFSKNLMPGIRLGYLIVPESLRKVFVTAKWLVDRHCDNVSQSVLAEFMSSGLFSRHLMKMRTLYAARHACLTGYREQWLQRGANLLPSSAGLHVCVLLHPDQRESELIDRAKGQGVGLYGIRTTYFAQPVRPGLVLGFGNLSVDEIASAMDRLLPLITVQASRLDHKLNS